MCRNLRKNKMLRVTLVMMLILSMVITTSLTVLATDEAPVIISNSQEISGESTASYIVESGSAHITLSDAKIDSNKSAIVVKDGATLELTLEGESSISVSDGNYACINVESGATLIINGGGILTATMEKNTAGAAIGGNADEKTGTITIDNGTIYATGGQGAGIGSGALTGNVRPYDSNYCENNGNVIVNGGYVYATGISGQSAAIGGGNHVDGGNITINGGYVETAGNIGSGCGSSKMQRDGNYTPYTGGNITINGGTVVARAIYDSAAIGGNIYGDSGIITITGGDITAIGHGRGAGIGGGYMGDANQITITGGTIYAEGGNKADSDIGRGGAGIGGGGVGRVSGNKTMAFGSAANVSISGGDITAIGGYKAAGIGTGSSHQSSDIDKGYVDLTQDQLKAKSSISIMGGTYEVYADGIKNAIDYDNCNVSISNAKFLSGRLVDDFGDELGQNGLDISTENTIDFVRDSISEGTYTLPVYTSPVDQSMRAYRAFACTCSDEGNYTIKDASAEAYELYGYTEADLDNYSFQNAPYVYHDNMKLVDMPTTTPTTPTVPANPTSPTNPTNPTTPVTPPVTTLVTTAVTTAVTGTVGVLDEATVTPEQAPLAAADDEQTLTKDSAAKAAGHSWALVNLICSILTVIMIVILTFSKKKRTEFEQLEDNQNDEAEKKMRNKFKVGMIGQILTAIVSVVAFILTEDMRNPMILTDKWTLLMVILAAASLVVYAAIGKRNDEEDERSVRA